MLHHFRTMKTSFTCLLTLAWALDLPPLFAADNGLRAGTAIVDVTPQEWPLVLRGSFFPKARQNLTRPTPRKGSRLRERNRVGRSS